MDIVRILQRQPCKSIRKQELHSRCIGFKWPMTQMADGQIGPGLNG